MLCNVCSYIDVDELIPPQGSDILSGTRQHATYHALEAAAKAGCNLCKAIETIASNMVTQPARLDRIRQLPVQLKLRLQGSTKPQYQGASKLMVSCGATVIAQMEAYVHQDSPIVQVNLKLISGRPIYLDPCSNECFSVAKDWIEDCMTSAEHRFCTNPVEDSPLPTRLIDIGPVDGSQNPRLIFSVDIPKSHSKSYAALSHCWGSSQPVTTQISTLSKRMKCIPMQLLTKNFRDAITIARNLGLGYIWIDSLCIIQDSDVDWQQEAARMADIYKNSYVTIAAESSTDGNGGMLNMRSFDFEPIEVPFVSKSYNFCTTIFIRPLQDDWNTCISGKRSALHSRAWVLQESLLAPRTIHYSSQQMFWECKSSSRAEGDVTPIRSEGNPNAQEWVWSRSKRFLSDVESVTDDASMSIKNILFMRWYTILSDYSNRKMTKPWDMFPALQGLASEFNIHLKDEYLAGLWKSDLLRGLLWSIEEPELCKLAQPYRAPSWSWASKIGKINNAQDALHLIGGYHAEILDIKVNLISTMNPYGQISTAHLRIRGRWKASSHWPTFELKPWEHRLVQNAEDADGLLFRDFDLGNEETLKERHAKGRRMTVLQIATWASRPDYEGVLHCLILESADDEAVGIYHRIGVTQVYFYPQEWIEAWEIGEFLIT